MVYVLLGAGFEETEAIAPIDLLRRTNIPVLTVGLTGKRITGGHNITVEADITIGQMDLTKMEMLVLPGGFGGVSSILNCQPAMDAISFAWENNKFIAAICAAPTILAKLGITDGKINFALLPELPDAKFGANLPYYLQFPFCEGKYRLKWGMGFTERLKIDFSGKNSPQVVGA